MGRVAFDRNLQLSKCEGKQAFIDPHLADKRAKAMRRRYDQAYQAYRCEFCRRWHIGSREHWQSGGGI